MSAKLLDGRPIATQLRQALCDRVRELVSFGMRPPHLRILLTGSNEASRIYADRLRKSGVNAGISVTIDHYGDSVSVEDFAQAIRALNIDPAVDAVVVAMPLPSHIPKEMVSQALNPRKDVDAITVSSEAFLYSGAAVRPPATAAAIIQLLKSYDVSIEGRQAVVVGRSVVVGRPTAMLLLRENATVTICHTRTAHLATYTTAADILVVATGRPKTITGEMVGSHTVVIDAGMNAMSDGIVGDVDFVGVEERAAAVTPVPGGVGPLTNIMLLQSVVDLYRETAFSSSAAKIR